MSAFVDTAFYVAIFVFAMAAAFFGLLLADRIILQQRRLGGRTVTATGPGASLLQPRASSNAVFQWIESSSSISEPAEREKIRRELSLAGFDSPAAPVWYVIARFGLAIGLPLAYLFLNYILFRSASAFGLIFWSLLLCGIGLIAPSAFVERRANSRRKELEFEFPDALDLMVVCVEAGLGLDATFVKVGQEMGETHPRISRELDRVADEIRAGRSRAEALRTMAERTDVPGIKSFVALVIQTEMLGSSITQTLRTYSTELRETRYIKAEEKALRIPVLMTVPLVTCILPVIVTALLLPPVIDMIRTLFPALSGH